MVPFTPRLIPAILPNLAHHVPMIQATASRTNSLLLSVIQALPPPIEPTIRQGTDKTSSSTPSIIPGSPTPAPNSTLAPRQGTSKDAGLPDSPPDPNAYQSGQSDRASITQIPRHRPSLMLEGRTNTIPQAPPVPSDTGNQTSRSDSPTSNSAISVPHIQQSPEASMLQEKDFFDYQATVNVLTLQFPSEHEETRIAALKWLIMLHHKAPKKVCLELSLYWS